MMPVARYEPRVVGRSVLRPAGLALALLLGPVAARAQVRAEEAVVRPARIAEGQPAPKVDGLLDEAVWRDIEPITDFRQYEPGDGVPASEKTEVRICYDRRFLYFGVRAYDSEPEKILARTFERDGNVDTDDSFTVAIDSLNNDRTAVAFDSNVLGTKLDVQYSEAGAYNESWNGIWYAKGNIDEEGYTLEIAIPFFALRFKPAEEVEMGLDLERIIRRKDELVNWPYLDRDHGFTSVSQYGRMVGLRGIERGVHLEIKPYGVGGLSETATTSDAVSNQAVSHKDSAEAGLDVKWGVTPNFTVDLTVNPDFAQVESDALRVNLDRFSLFYPEKRDFFIESADLFQFGLASSVEVFFSRRIGLRPGGGIVPLRGGVRAYGTVGRTNVGLMTMQTDGDRGVDSETFSVARVKHEVLERSYVGAIVTHRNGDDAAEDTTVGGDFLFHFGNNVRVIGAAARSERAEASPESDQDFATFTVSQRTGLYDWIVRYDNIGEDFDPGVGFVRRPDARTLTVNGHYRPRLDGKVVRQVTAGNLYQQIENHDGVLETRTVRPGLLLRFVNEDSLLAFYYDTYERVLQPFTIGGVTVPAGGYDNNSGYLSYASNRSRRFSFSAAVSGGGFYDGDIRSAELGVVFKPIPRLHLTAEYNTDNVELSAGSFDSNISTLQASYYFSPDLTTRFAAQYSSLLDDFVFNFRLRWIYAPGSEAWLVYDETHDFGREDPSLRNRALILKVVYNFNL